MNRRQRKLLRDVIIVLAVTAIAVVVMINFKDLINRSEAMRAMEHLGHTTLRYREKSGSLPPESYIRSIMDTLEGHARLTNMSYRAQWINFDAEPNEVLAYSEKNYPSSLLSSGYIVLRLNGSVEWMTEEQFEKILPAKQREREK
jgi:hypothetical protein